MRDRLGMVVVALAVGIGLGVAGSRLLGAQQSAPPSPPRPPSVAETVLLRTDLVGLPGRELIVSRFAAEPGWVHGRHRHPGHELVYVLEGAGTIQMDGRAPVALAPGAVAYMLPGQVHTGGNASRTASFGFLLVRIHDKGQPISEELP